MTHRRPSSARPLSASATLRFNPLFAAIVGQLLASAAMAAPTGGAVVGGEGTISQSGLETTITQGTDRLAIEWDSFNVATNERVTFVQPGESAVALNRILDLNGSQILGRIDANGRVILMNPNGIFFGENATVNVGSLVATGLNIDTADFMNGELLLQAVDNTAGAVINRGIINAATGGNVALIGKQVTNSGLISADLGRIALASGNAAVVTFDDQGLLGVRVDEAALQSELGMNPGVSNSGRIEASGGRILLTGSVSQDLFSRAVNAGDMSDGTEAIIHDDGSFTLGTSVDVLNTGVLSVSSSTDSAGEVVLAGRVVNQRGTVVANQDAGGDAGGIHLLATNSVRLTSGGTLSASGSADSGHIVLEGDQVIGNSDTHISTSGEVDITGYLHVKAPNIDAQNLTIRSIGTVRQTGAITVAGNTHLSLTADADLRLNNVANDFGSVTMQTGHTSFVSLTDSGGMDLGELDLLDSIVHIQSDGEIRQLEGTSITLDSSDLRLTGDSIALGTIADGSGVRLSHGWLDLNFSNALHAVNAISSPSQFDTSLITAKGYDGVSQINVRSQALFDTSTNYGPNQFALSATLDGFNVHIGRLNANTASVASIGDISQSGAIEANSFSLTAAAGGYAALNHQNNDFRTINLSLGHTSVVEIADKNDVLLGKLDVQDSRVSISTLGENSMVSQVANSTIDLYDSTLEIQAPRIYLGDKPGAALRLHGFSDLQAHYARGARIFGTSNGPAEFPEFVPFNVSGGVGTTELTVAGHGDFALNTSSNDYQFTIHQLKATDAHLASTYRVQQTGEISLSGTLHLELLSEAEINLNHSGNRINRLTANTGYTSNVTLYNDGDLILGNLSLGDSSLAITANGTITQESGTAMTLADTYLSLNGTGITFGQLADGSGASLSYSLLEILFSDFIDMVDAVSTGGEFDFSTIVVSGGNNESNGNELHLSQSTPLSVRASLVGDNHDLRIDLLDAENAELFTFYEITQTGKITLTGDLFLRTPAGGQVMLENPENDFNRITIESGHSTGIRLTDANDVLLGDWDMTDTSVTIRSLGEGATISQMENSHIGGSDSDVTLQAANINLGASGTADIGLSSLFAYFSESLTIDGSIRLGGISSYLHIEGTDGDNTLTIGEFADIDMSSFFQEHLIDLKGGNDTIEIFRDLNYGFFTGAGQDRIYLVNNEVNYTAEDFDAEQDEVLLLP